MTGSVDEAAPRTIGRYMLGGLIASGGMAAVHLGQMRGAAGFSRTVAIKKMHPHLASDPDFATMFADEARLAARVRHPNVVSTLDVVLQGANLCIVMEYVQGVTLAQLFALAIERGEKVPVPIAVAIMRDALQGLHAAHEAVDAEGQALGIVHRDVSPQNVIVGVDGVARVLDFGIAKANVRLHQTREGSGVKGKLAYMAPEQLEGTAVARESDVFAASIVLWEALTGQRAYAGANEGEIVKRLLTSSPVPPSTLRPELPASCDDVVMRGLARAPGDRFASAKDMAVALTASTAAAPAADVGEWVERIAAGALAARAQRVRQLETELIHDDAGVPPDAPDPDGTLPATPIEVAEYEATQTSRGSAPSRAGGRARIASVIALACAVTTVAVLGLVERRRTSDADATTATTTASAASASSPEASSTARGSEQPASTSTSSAGSASPSGRLALPATTPVTPATPATPSGTARRPGSRPPTSRAASPGIPDHL